LNGLLEKLGLGDRASGVLRALDKLHKIGRDGVTAELCEKVQTTTDQAARVLDFAHLTGTPSEILSRLDGMLQGNATGELGVARLRELFSVASHAGIPPERVDLDVSIARGLDYYTGTIYETFLTDDPKIGSICSGGRYDNLAGLFTSQKLPGVGASLGLDRLLAAMESFGMIGQASTPAPVLVVSFDATRVAEYARLGRMLRQAGINTEVFPDSRAVGKQLKYADKKGFRIAVIAGEDEFAAGVWQVKDLKAGTQSRVAEADLPSHLNDILKPA
ncbi:MAG: histidine--tRNA ligase, partial [Planctomycetaceae bacterium]